MITQSDLKPLVDESGRWQWPDPDCECVRMMRRAGKFRIVLKTWLELQIESLVVLPEDFLREAGSPEAIRLERMRRFREAAFDPKSISAEPNVKETELFIQCCVKSHSHGRAVVGYPRRAGFCGGCFAFRRDDAQVAELGDFQSGLPRARDSWLKPMRI